MNREGVVTDEIWFEAPYSSLVHDFTVTPDYAIFRSFRSSPTSTT